MRREEGYDPNLSSIDPSVPLYRTPLGSVCIMMDIIINERNLQRSRLKFCCEYVFMPEWHETEH